MGTARLMFQNGSIARQTVTITAIPATSASEYNATLAKSVTFDIAGAGIRPSALPTGAASSSTTTVALVKAVYGSRNNEQVRLLQRILKADGVFSGEVSGNFFDATRAAILKFQKKYAISLTGTAGPLTLRKLNEVAKAKGIQ
jgi:hypothetical protein